MKKPHIRYQNDEYAVATNQYWLCSYAGIGARGRLPEIAYFNLKNHFKRLKVRNPCK